VISALSWGSREMLLVLVFAADAQGRSWHKASLGDVCLHVSDWVINGHAVDKLFGSFLTYHVLR
jgi:hypothetical protein